MSDQVQLQFVIHKQVGMCMVFFGAWRVYMMI